MELKAIDISAHAKGLIVVVNRGGKPLRPLGQIKAVAMPLEDNGLIREMAEQRVHLSFQGHRDRIPADLRKVSVINLSAASCGDELGSQADSEKSHLLFEGGSDNRLFPLEKWILLFLGDAHRPAEDYNGSNLVPIFIGQLPFKEPDAMVTHAFPLEHLSKASHPFLGSVLEDQKVLDARHIQATGSPQAARHLFFGRA